jgi:hypothetical protein
MEDPIHWRQRAIDEFTNMGFASVALITPGGTRWGIQGDRGGVTEGVIFTSLEPVSSETLYYALEGIGFHQPRGLEAGYEIPWSGAQVSTYTPNAPTAFAVSGTPAQTTAIFTFTPSAVDVTHSAATLYTVQTSPPGAGTWTNRGTSTGSPITASGLTPNTLYDARLVPNNSAGDGPASSTIPVTTNIPGTLNATTNSAPVAESLDAYSDWIVMGGGGHYNIDARKSVGLVPVDLIDTRNGPTYARNFMPGCTAGGADVNGGLDYSFTGDAVTEGAFWNSALVAQAMPMSSKKAKLEASGAAGVRGVYWDMPADLALHEAKITVSAYANATTPIPDLLIRAHLSDSSTPDQVIQVPLEAFVDKPFEVVFSYAAISNGRSIRISYEFGSGSLVPVGQGPAMSMYYNRVTYKATP